MTSKSEQREKPKRLLGGKGSVASKQRHRLYSVAHAQASKALSEGFYLEAVTLFESMLADRIEARIQFLKRDEPSRHFVDIIGSRLKYWRDIEEVERDYVLELVNRIWRWIDNRNKTLHEFVKVTEINHHLSDRDRLRMARGVALEGKGIVREISRFVGRHNKWPKNTG